MFYFSKYKSILYALDNDNYDLKAAKNIFTRVQFIREILDNSDVYYEYSMKGDDNAETIAHKLYGDANRYWIILLANQIIDPYFQMPLRYNSFVNHIVDKYGSIEYAESNIHHYEKKTTTTTKKLGIVESQTITSILNKDIAVDDLNEHFLVYNPITQSLGTVLIPTISNPIVDDPSGIKTVTIDDYDGVPVEITTSIKYYAVTYYEYEDDLNEKRRNIRLIKPAYVDMIESEFANLIGK